MATAAENVSALDEELPETLPSKKLSDIVVDRDAEMQLTQDKISSLGHATVNAKAAGMPSEIVGDWMYLGNLTHAAARNVVAELGITHILNVSRDICCYHIGNEALKYARIDLNDFQDANLYDYFKAAAAFIDECNPMYTTSYPQNRILIHCRAGVSRSASTVISYLIHRAIRWDNASADCLDIIRKRLQYAKGTAVGQDGLKLSVAYYHVKSCRSCIGPNEGFISQLEMWERLNHQGRSTRDDLPDFWAGSSETDRKLFADIESRREKGDISAGDKQDEPRRKCVIL